jgi:putative NIF3 family GTP cyclohydrolase 1 type 2
MDAAREAGADVLVTADLKHHNAVEAVTQRQASSAVIPPSAAPGSSAVGPESIMALVDVAHWASEVPWLHLLARRLRAEFGDTVEVTVSDVATDPWTVRVPSPHSERDEGI